jgi:hypothetical protein
MACRPSPRHGTYLTGSAPVAASQARKATAAAVSSHFAQRALSSGRIDATLERVSTIPGRVALAWMFDALPS